MNKNSNTYIILYASIMVIIVAAVLSYVSLSLGKIQSENVRIEKMGDILRSVGQGKGADTASDKATYIAEQYQKYIVDSYAVDAAGNRVDGADAFNLLINLKAEYDKPQAERRLPVFVSRDDQGKTSYVIPIWGKGLWGPIWGYIALADDWDTVNGAVFDHKSETPGLGAEIASSGFQAQFRGKHILDSTDRVVAIAVEKGGADPNDQHAVDALSGGTLTSRGVEDMLKSCLGDYDRYIQRQREAAGTSVLTAQADAAVADVIAQSGSVTGEQVSEAAKSASLSTEKSDRDE